MTEMTTTQVLSTSALDFAWLELTPSCQLRCQHCYVASMPGLGHGRLSLDDWKQVITDLASNRVRFVQFVGGEATIHPHFCELLEYAALQGLRIEVYTNLVGITDRMWELFVRYHVRIATSFYTDVPAIHDEITGLRGSYQKTWGNIQRALASGLTLRVGMVRIREDQHIDAAKRLLTDLGVDPRRIGSDRARGVGRGANLIQEDPISALCGKCTQRRCVITASGEVYPCVFSRGFPVGNVRNEDIGSIVTGKRMLATTAMLNTAFTVHRGIRDDPCPPDCNPECDPQVWPPCSPDCCPETIASCEPSEEPPPEE